MPTVSTRIDDTLKEQIDELEINTSEVVRDALTAEVKRQRRERLIEQGHEVSQTLQESGVTSEDIQQSIREDRDADLEDR